MTRRLIRLRTIDLYDYWQEMCPEHHLWLCIDCGRRLTHWERFWRWLSGNFESPLVTSRMFEGRGDGPP